MFSIVNSGTIVGINGVLIKVEVDISEGLPAFDIVGLPDSSVRESKERVRSAIKNIGINFPIKRIIVNLSPADIKKEGPKFDLPIAIGILCSMGYIQQSKIDSKLFIGELSLDGKIRSVNGVLPIVYNAFENNLKECIVPYDNANEAAVVNGMDIIGVHTLTQLINHLQDKSQISSTKCIANELFNEKKKDTLDFKDVKGQGLVKRALEIAASGYHNLMMLGPPGSGKTMMAKRLPSIMPDLTLEESIKITKIYSSAGKLKNGQSLITSRPFRSPHHTVSSSALTGGGSIPKPGEVSLSHGGVLFLDEVAEFSKSTLEVLRQPIEDKTVTIARVNATYSFPSDFMLVVSLNPCPCGYFPDTERCHCTPIQIKRYLSKISGPLLDRIDLHVEASSINYEDLNMTKEEESSQSIKARVIKAIDIQRERYKNENILFNSQLAPSMISKYCYLDNECNDMLKKAYDKLDLSVRAYHRILKVARTIADLDNSQNIDIKHISEAIQYRSLDRKYWT